MNILEFCTNPQKSIRDVIGQLDETAKKLVFVTEERVLKGSVTDGDIRRWILKNGDLSQPVTRVMNASPIFLKEKEKAKAYEVMKKNRIEGIEVHSW